MSNTTPNKETFKARRLTVNQETFVNQLALGKTQREAYKIAYPNSVNWNDSSIDSQASRLFKRPQVKSRYEELISEIRANEQENTMWTREESIATLRYVIDKNKEDLERINKAHEEELEFLLKAASEETDPAKIQALILGALKKRQQRRISGVHNGGIVSAVAELNKMQGFNEENINMNQAVYFTGEDKLED